MNQPKSKLKIGVIGGGVAVAKALPALVELDVLTYLCKVSELPSIDVKLKTNILEDFLSTPRMQAVYLATPVATHMEIANVLLGRGLPVLVEKPLALSTIDSQRIESSLTNRLFVAFKKRFGFAAEQIRSDDMYSAGNSHISYTWHVKHPGLHHWKALRCQSGGGVLMDIGSHALDFFEYVMGDIETITVTHVEMMKESDIEERIQFHVGFSSGSTGEANLAWVNSTDIQDVTYRGCYSNIKWISDTPTYDQILLNNSRGTRRLTYDKADDYRKMFASFATALAGDGEFTPTYEHGVRNMHLIESGYRSVASSMTSNVNRATP